MTDLVDSYLQVWRDKLSTELDKELTPADLCSLFRLEHLREAFFGIIDKEQNECLKYEEWIGIFTKCIDPKKISLVDWFVQQYQKYTEISSEPHLTKKDLIEILSDNEFGFRFSMLITNNKIRGIKPAELMTTLEIIASLSTDGKWLSWLKYQFINAASTAETTASETVDGSDMKQIRSVENKITLKQFMNSFEFKEAFLPKRLFDYLDKDHSGYLCIRDFINGLEVIVNGSPSDKIRFLFNVFDVNGDGRIDFEEMKLLLNCCMDDTPYIDMDQVVEELTAYLFTKTDKDDSGDISFDELQEAFKKYDSIFSQLTFSTSVWIKPKTITKSQKKGRNFSQICKKYINNKRPILIFWSIYALITLICAIHAVVKYYDWNLFPNSNLWMTLARINGVNLNFNAALILVLMLRKHFTWMRTKGANRFLPLDEFIELHKTVGYIILVQSSFHIGAHLVYLFLECEHFEKNFWEILFTAADSISYPTGVILLSLFVVIFTFAMPFVRNNGYFQAFHWFHRLVIPWLLIIVIHAPNFWIWIIIPFFCYILENILRYRKISSHSFGETYIKESFVLPSKVTHLVIKKPAKFHYSPGDYIFINIPIIAKYEWHPFSISSAPENSDSLWLHIRGCGNWTNKLLDLAQSSKLEDENKSFNRSRQTLQPGSVMRHNAMHMQEEINIMPNSGTSFQRVNFNITDDLMNGVKKNKLELILENSTSIESTQKETEKGLETVAVKTNQTIKGILKSSKATVEDSIEDTPALMKAEITEDLSEGDLMEKKRSNDSCLNSINKDSSIEFALEDKEKNEYARVENSSFKNSIIETGLNKDSLNEVSVIINLEIDETVSGKSKNCGDKIDSTTDVILPGVAFRNKENKLNSSMKGNNRTISSVGKRIRDSFTNTAIGSINSITNQKNKQEDKKELNKTDSYTDSLGYHKMYTKGKLESIGPENSLRLRVLIDGPYGTPSYSIFDAEHAVLVGAGIGITPFASILQSAMRRYRQNLAKCPNCNINLNKHLCMGNKLNLKKIDFIWITREQRSLEWFISMLSQMEIQQRKYSENDGSNMFMESHLYVTSAKKQSDLKALSLQYTLDAIYSQEDNRFIDGLRKRTRYGRPNWDVVMQNLIRQKKGKIDVFYCGPPALASTLAMKCREYEINFCQEIF